MSENKQYLAQKLEKGTLLINESVLETIITDAVNEVEGVAGLSSKPGMDIIEVIGKKNIGRALKISISQNNEVRVICNINVFYGQNVVEIAKTVQMAIKNALESSANAVVAGINVNVCGIVRK